MEWEKGSRIKKWKKRTIESIDEDTKQKKRKKSRRKKIRNRKHQTIRWRFSVLQQRMTNIERAVPETLLSCPDGS
jgi:hypothetical protein